MEHDQLRKVLLLSDGQFRNLLSNKGPLIERWVMVKVDEAYVHCSKHIPLLKKLDKKIY